MPLTRTALSYLRHLSSVTGREADVKKDIDEVTEQCDRKPLKRSQMGKSERQP